MARRFSLADLDATRKSFSAEIRADKNHETFTLAVSIVRHFFGHDWYMEHVFQDAEGSRPDGFMRIDYTPGPKGEAKTSRLLDFAENLFNLQHIEGFDDRVELNVMAQRSAHLYLAYSGERSDPCRNAPTSRCLPHPGGGKPESRARGPMACTSRSLGRPSADFSHY